MDRARFLNQPWRFEPHSLSGVEIDGEIMPFGYISAGTGVSAEPIFELADPGFADMRRAEYLTYARMMAAAPDLATSLSAMIDRYGELEETEHPVVAEARAVLAKARGL